MTKETKAPAIFLHTQNYPIALLMRKFFLKITKNKIQKESIMKKLILFLLCCSIYASAIDYPTAYPTVPTEAAKVVTSGTDTNGSSTTISGDYTGLSVSNKSGRFTNSGNIWGTNEFGAYVKTNSWYPYRFNNNGNISSDNMIGFGINGDNLYLDNGVNGTIYGAITGLDIRTLTGGGPENVIQIDNNGRIESGETAILIHDSNKTINIENGAFGYIGGNIGIHVSNGASANIVNYGEIEGAGAPAIIYSATTTNKLINNGMIKGRLLEDSDWIFNGDAVLSAGDLEISGSEYGIFEGDINYIGSLDGKLTINNFYGSFDRTKLGNWKGGIDVINGTHYFDTSSNLFIRDGATVQLGTTTQYDGEQAGNVTIYSGGQMSPYQNTDKGNNASYDKQPYNKIYLENLTIKAGGELTIDFKDTKYNSGDWYRDGPPVDNQRNIDGTDGGYGHSSYKGKGYDSSTEHRINHDKIDVSGSFVVEDGAILNIFDYTHTGADLWNTYKFNTIIGEDVTDEELEKFTVNIYSAYFGFGGWENGKIILEANNPTNQKTLTDWLVDHVFDPKLSVPIMAPAPYNVSLLSLEPSEDLRHLVFGIDNEAEYNAIVDDLNKMEYASLATSNINSIDNRVSNHFDQLNSAFRDANGVNIWADAYYADFSLDGKGNHDISGNGTEFAVGFDKQLTESFKFGFSFNHIDYNTVVNDSGVDTNIDSEGYGLNAMAMYKQGNLTHKAMLGYAQYDNVNKDVASFDSSEMFAAYRAEYLIKTAVVDISPIVGLRFAQVSYDKMAENSENGLNAYTQNSLETELGVKIAKQFKKLNVNVSASWAHELLDTQNVATAYTSYGDFKQQGIERDGDSFRASVGVQYQISENVTFGLDYAKDMSSNSESNSINGKLSFNF